MEAMGQQLAFARDLAEPLAYVHSHVGLSPALTLAMAAATCRWGEGDGRRLWQQMRNPWGLASPSARAGGHAWLGLGRAPAWGPARFPSLREAAEALASTLRPSRTPGLASAWQLRSDPAAFLAALEAAGWPAVQAEGDETPWSQRAIAALPIATAALASIHAGLDPAHAWAQPPPQPLEPTAAAQLVREHFAAEQAADILALAMAVSGLDPLAVGGSWQQHPEADLIRAHLACVPPQGRVRADAGPAPYTAFGLWQVDVALHARALVRFTHSAEPGVWALWLFAPERSAPLVQEIVAHQGLRPWQAAAAKVAAQRSAAQRALAELPA